MKKNIQNDFPVLQQKQNGYSLIYFDSAATSQKPRSVIDALSSFYATSNATVNRGIYQLGEKASELYEQARQSVAHFINASDACQIIFTRNTTESINLVAATWGNLDIKPCDHILITELEHHSNMLPWQRLAAQKQAILDYIPVNPDGTLDMLALPALLAHKPKLVAISHISNVVGVHNPIQTIIDQVHAYGGKVLIDAAQSIAHQPIDVQKMNCDFLAFSGHKMLGPTGIGVLYGKKELLEAMPPYQVGGGMAYEVDLQGATYRSIPQKFEAGTPAIAQAIGLKAAIDYLNTIDFAQLRHHEAALCTRLIDGLLKIPEIRIIGPIDELKKVGHLVTFSYDGVHAHDLAAYLDRFGICVRAGHHCAQPLAKKLGLQASVRVSFYLYNTLEQVDFFIEIMHKLQQEKF